MRRVVSLHSALASVTAAALVMVLLMTEVSGMQDAVSAHVDAVSAHVDAVSAHVDAVSAHVDANGRLSDVPAVPWNRVIVAMPDRGVQVFRPPVEAPVSDPFRLPDGPYGPGNRGIEYATDAGDVVRASAGGVVEFAGPVAGNLYVTLDHGGGLLSSYSYLSRMSVSQGDHVVRGDVIAFASGRPLHFSVRKDGEYVDPAAFIGVRRVRVRLVPVEPYR